MASITADRGAPTAVDVAAGACRGGGAARELGSSSETLGTRKRNEGRVGERGRWRFHCELALLRRRISELDRVQDRSVRSWRTNSASDACANAMPVQIAKALGGDPRRPDLAQAYDPTLFTPAPPPGDAAMLCALVCGMAAVLWRKRAFAMGAAVSAVAAMAQNGAAASPEAFRQAISSAGMCVFSFAACYLDPPRR